MPDLPQSNGPTDNRQRQEYPAYRNHFVPRTRAGRWAVILFLSLFALTQPPILHLFANRIQPWLFGLPFLYAYLLILYLLLIGVLFWARWKDL